MSIFELFGSSSKNTVHEEQENLVAPVNATEETSEETSEKKMDDDMITINYGTGMPIDIIYSYIKKSYESNGYNDSFISTEPAYKEKNIERLRGLLEIKFNQVRLSYEGRIQILEQRIEDCRNNGLFATMGSLNSDVTLYKHHLDKLTEMENDYKEGKPYMTTFLTSYENGFLRGIAAIAMGATNNNMSNDKKL